VSHPILQSLDVADVILQVSRRKGVPELVQKEIRAVRTLRAFITVLRNALAAVQFRAEGDALNSFAVALLMEGVPIERVSILLGHSSTRITERHYSPWVRERQEQAEADVRRTWQRDPVALMETKGTPQVHGKGDAPN
jgi:integrase